MRDDHMRGKTTVDIDPKMARRGTDVLFLATARGALAAADPWIDRNPAARWDAFGGRAGLLDDPGYLVAERERQHAASAHIELLSFAQGEIAVPYVEV